MAATGQLPARYIVELDAGDLARLRDVGIPYSPVSVERRNRTLAFTLTHLYDVATFGEMTPSGRAAFLEHEARRVSAEWLDAMIARFPR